MLSIINKYQRQLPLLIFILYFFALLPALLGAPFSDDLIEIFKNSHFVGGEGIGYIWANRTWPLSMALHYLFLQIFGDTYFLHHLFNFLIHLLNSYLLYKILTMTRFQHPRVAAMLFFIQLSNALTVGWIIQLKTLVAILLALCSFYSFLEFRKTNQAKWVFPIFVFYWCSLLSKSSMILLPFVFLAYDLLVANLRFNFKKMVYLIPLVSSIVFHLCKFLIKSPNSPKPMGSAAVAVSNMNIQLDFFEIIIVKATFIGKCLLYYIRQSIFPIDVNVFHRRFLLGENSAADIVALVFSYFVVLSVLCLSMVAIKKKKELRVPLFLILSYLLTFAPVSGIVTAPFMNVSPVADNHLYGLLLFAIPLMIYSIHHLFHRYKKTLNVFLLFIVGYHLFAVHLFSYRLDGDKNFFERVTIQNPTYYYSYISLGDHYMMVRDFKLAKENYKMAKKIIAEESILYRSSDRTLVDERIDQIDQITNSSSNHL